MNKKYRLYIDESGTHNYSNSGKIGKRYLALIGVIVSEKENVEKLKPRVLEIKRLLTDDPDELPVLHREDIIEGAGCFRKLEDADIKKKYDALFFNLIEDTEYVICCIVLDKQAHFNRYGNTAFHPYHYCLSMLLERYTRFLEEKSAKGDVMAEARGKKEDKELGNAYKEFYERGTYFISRHIIQSRLTSSELKIKPKTAGIEGIELADLLSLACKFDTLHKFGQHQTLSDNFCKQVIEKVQVKYRRNPSKTIINGFGRKLVN